MYVIAVHTCLSIFSIVIVIMYFLYVFLFLLPFYFFWYVTICIFNVNTSSNGSSNKSVFILLLCSQLLLKEKYSYRRWESSGLVYRSKNTKQEANIDGRL